MSATATLERHAQEVAPHEHEEGATDGLASETHG
jgi:hypothetical protein